MLRDNRGRFASAYDTTSDGWLSSAQRAALSDARIESDHERGLHVDEDPGECRFCDGLRAGD